MVYLFYLYNGVDMDKNNFKTRINWGILLLSAYLILIIINWKNSKYFFNLLKELTDLLKNNSKYVEDGDFILIHNPKKKNL